MDPEVLYDVLELADRYEQVLRSFVSRDSVKLSIFELAAAGQAVEIFKKRSEVLQ
jgi:hypothetical protein